MSLNDDQFIHYSRQILLPELGEYGQTALMSAHVAIVGIGGLGHLCAQYLAAAGVGRLTLIDGDSVEVSNLPRQLIFAARDSGKNKAKVCADKLRAVHADCALTAADCFIDNVNASLLLKDASLVLDCSDNFETRQLINLWCVRLSIPSVIASAVHFSGQLLTVDLVRYPQGGCYHCLFPSELKVSQRCDTTGVLGPMVGVMASMQALQAIKHIAKITPNAGELLRFDGLSMVTRHAALARDPSCAVCHTQAKERTDESH